MQVSKCMYVCVVNVLTHSLQAEVSTNQPLYMYNIWCMYVKTYTDVEVSCYAYEGIDAVKSALKAGLTQSTEAFPIKINLIAPPQYVITVTTLERTEGIAKLNTAIQIIRETIEEKDGLFNTKMEVRFWVIFCLAMPTCKMLYSILLIIQLSELQPPHYSVYRSVRPPQTRLFTFYGRI